MGDLAMSDLMFSSLLVLLSLQAVLAVAPFEALLEEWERWKVQYGKNYTKEYGDAIYGKYSQEESFRMKIWIKNKALIERHNRHFYKGVHSYKLAMNEFGDLLHQEFVSNMNGYKETERIDGAKFLGSIFEI